VERRKKKKKIPNAVAFGQERREGEGGNPQRRTSSNSILSNTFTQQGSRAAFPAPPGTGSYH